MQVMNRVKSLLVLAALTLLMLAGMSCISWPPLFTFGDVHDAHTALYIVEPGDTLQSIAKQSDPNDYILAVVSWIKHHNDLGDAYLQPGQALVVPRG